MQAGLAHINNYNKVNVSTNEHTHKPDPTVVVIPHHKRDLE